MQLFKRGDNWYCSYYDNQGRRIKRSTHCTDRRAAEIRAREWEREAADPAYAARQKASVTDALQLLIKHIAAKVKAGRRSQETCDFYTRKAGHWVRMLETDAEGNYRPFPLVNLTAGRVDECVEQRREEGAAESTIQKELTTLRVALKLARRHGIWLGDPAAILPLAFSPEYKPVERWLPRDEVEALLDALPPARGAIVAFIVYAMSAPHG